MGQYCHCKSSVTGPDKYAFDLLVVEMPLLLTWQGLKPLVLAALV